MVPEEAVEARQEVLHVAHTHIVVPAHVPTTAAARILRVTAARIVVAADQVTEAVVTRTHLAAIGTGGISKYQVKLEAARVRTRCFSDFHPIFRIFRMTFHAVTRCWTADAGGILVPTSVQSL